MQEHVFRKRFGILQGWEDTVRLLAGGKLASTLTEGTSTPAAL